MNHFFKSLLHWFLFSGTMFFAAGAAIDAGALDGAIGDGVAENGAESGAEGGDRSDDGVGDEESGNQELGESGAEKPGDGRTLPKNIQGTLKTLKEAHPELAKDIDELRKGYFDSKGHREFFKSPAEARQAKATLELVGGSEGIAQLQEKVAAIELVDSAFEQGDPQVLDDIASDYPEGFKKLIAPALDKLEKLDPQAYGKTMQPHVFAAMERAGMGQVLDAIGQAIAGNDLARAKELIGKSLAWYDGQKQQAGQRQKTDDPERAKFDTERQKFQQEKETSFRNDIGRQTLAHQTEQISKALVPYLKSKPLGQDAKTDLLDGVNREINQLLKADATYQSQVKALLAAKTRDAGRIVRYINAAVAEAAPKAVKAVWARRYGTAVATRPAAAAAAGTDKTKTTQANPAASGPVKISAKPKREDVDWSKTKDILYITNKAYMKNGPHKGKLVTW